MADDKDNVIDFQSRKNGDNKPVVEKAKPPKHEFTITFKENLQGNYPEVKQAGYLSLGPVFAAIVDENDMIEIVVAAEEVLYIKKGPEVRDIQLTLPGINEPVTAQVRVLQPGTPEHTAALAAQASEKPVV